MEAMGLGVVLVETVGVGQDEVEIVRMADTTVVVTIPGLGDDIQAIKAGILEAGDIFVVNKADRDGAGRTVNELKGMLSLSGDHNRRAGWEPPIVSTCAIDGKGLDELVDTLDEHYKVLTADGGRMLTERRKEGLPPGAFGVGAGRHDATPAGAPGTGRGPDPGDRAGAGRGRRPLHGQRKYLGNHPGRLRAQGKEWSRGT